MVEFRYNEKYVREMLEKAENQSGNTGEDTPERKSLRILEIILKSILEDVILKIESFSACFKSVSEESLSEYKKDLAYLVAVNIMYNYSNHKLDKKVFDRVIREVNKQVE